MMLYIDEKDLTRDKALKDKIINELIDSTLTISFINNDGEDITEDNIVSESMTLKQSICDEDRLKFGGCIASEFKIQLLNTEDRVFNTTSLKNKWIKVVLTHSFPTGEALTPSSALYPSENLYPGEVIDSHSWVLFIGYIDSAVAQKDDKNIIDVVAYDRLAKMHNTKISGHLYKALKNNEATCKTLSKLCCNNIDYYEWEFFEIGPLRNYDWEENKEQITKGELLRCICEINGGFGFVDPNANYFRIRKFVDKSPEVYEAYENLETEDNQTTAYSKVIFPYAGNIQNKGSSDWGGKTGLYPNSENNAEVAEEDISEDNTCYDLTENILAWDYTDIKDSAGGINNLVRISEIYSAMTGQAKLSYDNVDELPEIIKELFNKVCQNTKNQLETTYTPFKLKADGRPWVEVGDNILIKTPRTNIYGEYVDINGNVVENVEEADYEEVNSIVLSRTLSGIKALTDEIEAKGE